MAARQKKKPSTNILAAPPTRLQRVWERMLISRLPLVNSLAYHELEHDLQSNDPRAAAILARNLDAIPSEKIKYALTNALKKVTRPECIDRIWAEWMRARSPRMLEILVIINQPATSPAETRAYSLLQLGRIKQIEDASPDLVLPLIHACEDADDSLATTARQVIGHLRKEDALDILCAHWAHTRGEFLENIIITAGILAQNPVEVRLLTALKLNQPDQIATNRAEIVAPLIQAARDADTEIASRADYLLRHALSGAALTEFCLRWSQTRDAHLETILLQSQLLPRQPQPLRLLCALKLGHQEVAQKSPPRNLETLLSACQDTDETIQANARIALRHLQSRESQEELCKIFLSNGNEEARLAAVEAGYHPAEQKRHALFLFLTAQWQLYETIDFDQRILRAIYDTATPELRQRMARTVQAAGRIEFLTILTGADNRQRTAKMDDAEARLVIQMLESSQQWQKLWLLAQELPLAHSYAILKNLRSQNWAPQHADEQALYHRLVERINQPLVTTAAELTSQLPAAVPLATLRIRGRVNDLAFAPDLPILGLATSSRKIVLWDYQKGQVQQVLTGFAHSVGQVTFLPDGQLVSAERTIGEAKCEIIGFDGQQHYLIGSHDASVTALIPLSDGSLLSTGRDQKIIHWDVTARRIIAERKLTDWPRCAAVSDDGRLAALVSDRVQLLQLPGLTPLDNLPPIYSKDHQTRLGISRCASFAPSGTDLLTGQMNGQVTHYPEIDSTRRRQKRNLDLHIGPLVGLEFLPRHDLTLTLGAEGELHFIEWPGGTRRSLVKAPLINLSSLKVSGDGNFLAIGSGQDAFTLWDLRTLDLPAIFAKPIPDFRPEHLAAIKSLVDVKEIPAAIRNAMQYLQELLQYRYRFDIQVAEISHIQPGEFDILVDNPEENSGYNG